MGLVTENIAGAVLDEISIFSPELVYVFGSFAMGEATEDSDLDVAFLSRESFDPMDVFLTAQRIASRLDCDVDLVQLKNSTTVFQKEVVEHGTVICKKSERIQDDFELLVFKKYIKLNEERAEILEAYGLMKNCRKKVCWSKQCEE